MTDCSEVAGVVIAGGQATRMGGGDKCLCEIRSRPVLSYVLDRLSPQLGPIALNANGDPDRFAHFRIPVLKDEITGSAGPLAGVHAGMKWARALGKTYLASVAADTPFFPRNLVVQMVSAAKDTPTTIAVAWSNGFPQPVFGLWPTALADDLENWLRSQAARKVMLWVRRHSFIRVEFSYENTAIDPFFNINTPDDLHTAGEMVQNLNL